MQAQTVTHDDIEVAVGALTGRGSMLRDALLKLVPDQKEWRGSFVICMTQTRSAKNLPFSIFTSAPDEETFQKTYQAFLDLEVDFLVTWTDTCASFSRPAGDQKKE